MALQSISQEKFDSYNVTKYPTGVAKEEYWYSDDEANILGIILRDNFDKDWGYVILALDETKEYSVSDVEASIETDEEAINTLTSKMREISKTGKIEKDIYNSTLFDKTSNIIISDINEEIKKFFKKYPHKLYDIHPRKFEELVASILEDLGFEVELTKATRDGGRDIIASIKNAVTNFLSYIECKRYSSDNKIDVGIIRQVQGVHYTLKPAKSIIVTTSFFTKDAQEEAKRIENQLDLKDFNDIKQWLERY